MAALYTDVPNDWSEVEPYVNKGKFEEDLFRKRKCFFYDACSFWYHANLKPENVSPILRYIKDQEGMIVITRCILMELASHSGTLNQEYILYCKEIIQSGIELYVIYEEDLFRVMLTCFNANAMANQFLVWAVRTIKSPVSTITKTLDEDEALSNVVIKGQHLESGRVYAQFFPAVRANKEAGDNLGEELLGICLYILSQLPGEEDGKFCVITDDKGAAGKIDNLFQKTKRRFRGKRIIIFSTLKLAQILYRETYITERTVLIELLKIRGSAAVKVLGLQIYDLNRDEISLACEEAADYIMNDRMHIIF